MKKTHLSLLVLLMIMALFYFNIVHDFQETSDNLIEASVPEFVFPLLHQEGLSFDSESLKGQVTLINVWASWCVTCRIEHPLLMQVAKNEGLNLYGLNYKDTRADALKWLEFFGNPYSLVLVDETGTAGVDFGANGLPGTFIIDAKGRVRHKHIGALKPRDWDETVLPIVRHLEAEF